MLKAKLLYANLQESSSFFPDMAATVSPGCGWHSVSSETE
jgi:hypothetical protein